MRELICVEELLLTLSTEEWRAELQGALSVRALDEAYTRTPLDVTLLWAERYYAWNPQLSLMHGALMLRATRHAWPTTHAKEVLRWRVPLGRDAVPLTVERPTSELLQLQAHGAIRKLCIRTARGRQVYRLDDVGAGCVHKISTAKLVAHELPLRCTLQLAQDTEPLGVQTLCSEAVLDIVILVT